MKVIKSITTTDAVLTSSNITETEYPAWVSNATYAIAARVIYQHKIYEAVLGHTNKTTPPDLDLVNWMPISYSNKYRMFDNIISNSSSRVGGITFKLTPSQVVDSIVFLNVNAATVRIVMTDPVAGVVYDQTQVLSSVDNVVDHYSYFFAPVGLKKISALFLDLPSYPTATIDAYIDSGAALVEVGEVIYGQQMVVGKTNYGTSIGIKSFSRKEIDEFGNVKVVKRKNSKFAEYDIDIDNYKLAEVQRYFAEIDSVPSVFIGNPDMEELVVFGFYNDFKATISFPTISKCSLRVEGLV